MVRGNWYLWCGIDPARLGCKSGNNTSNIEDYRLLLTSDYPFWLVFEVENDLQIRQDQYKVAQHLIDNPGDVIQLNMGLGKVSFMSLYCIFVTHSFSNLDSVLSHLFA